MMTGSIICTVITPLKRNHMVYENPIYYVITPVITPVPFTYLRDCEPPRRGARRATRH